MGNQFLIADVLSLEGNYIMRPSSLQSMIQTLNLFVSLQHLKETTSCQLYNISRVIM